MATKYTNECDGALAAPRAPAALAVLPRQEARAGSDVRLAGHFPLPGFLTA
ncbi:hypothetical protein [Cupriavidus necator]